MKYKNINAAIHNFAHSFVSLMNYVDNGYVIDDLTDIASLGLDIEIDWVKNTFMPEAAATPRIKKAMADYHSDMKRHFQSHQLDVNRISAMKFFWPAGGRKYMWAEDDRGKQYTIYVSEIK
jgi:hypothetical protein